MGEQSAQRRDMSNARAILRIEAGNRKEKTCVQSFHVSERLTARTCRLCGLVGARVLGHTTLSSVLGV
jgi:hypothetical protein